MNKRNEIIDRLTNHMPDYEQTRKYFFEHWRLINLLGEVNYFSLYGYYTEIESKEEALAFYLLGACKIFSSSLNDDPNTVKQGWKLVLPLIADIVPKEVKVKDYHIKVEYITSDE